MPEIMSAYSIHEEIGNDKYFSVKPYSSNGNVVLSILWAVNSTRHKLNYSLQRSSRILINYDLLKYVS